MSRCFIFLSMICLSLSLAAVGYGATRMVSEVVRELGLAKESADLVEYLATKKQPSDTVEIVAFVKCDYGVQESSSYYDLSLKRDVYVEGMGGHFAVGVITVPPSQAALFGGREIPYKIKLEPFPAHNDEDSVVYSTFCSREGDFALLVFQGVPSVPLNHLPGRMFRLAPGLRSGLEHGLDFTTMLDPVPAEQLLDKAPTVTTLVSLRVSHTILDKESATAITRAMLNKAAGVALSTSLLSFCRMGGVYAETALEWSLAKIQKRSTPDTVTKSVLIGITAMNAERAIADAQWRALIEAIQSRVRSGRLPETSEALSELRISMEKESRVQDP